MCIAQFDMIWDSGYRFDTVFWPDDMGYKGTPFFQARCIRSFCSPYPSYAQNIGYYQGEGRQGYVHPDDSDYDSNDALNELGDIASEASQKAHQSIKNIKFSLHYFTFGVTILFTEILRG